jgi:hypothetical protein
MRLEVLIAVASVLVAIVVAACGGGSPGPSQPPAY